MNDNGLPEFEHRDLQAVHAFAKSVFGDNLVQIQPYDDGHFRAVFKETQFTLTEEKPVPSKSQWNTLKKRFKRREKEVFLFRETGEHDCEAEDVKCYYIDFGFFLD